MVQIIEFHTMSRLKIVIEGEGEEGGGGVIYRFCFWLCFSLAGATALSLDF